MSKLKLQSRSLFELFEWGLFVNDCENEKHFVFNRRKNSLRQARQKILISFLHCSHETHTYCNLIRKNYFLARKLNSGGWNIQNRTYTKSMSPNQLAWRADASRWDTSHIVIINCLLIEQFVCTVIVTKSWNLYKIHSQSSSSALYYMYTTWVPIDFHLITHPGC